MIAYHITRRDYVGTILRKGILPFDKLNIGRYNNHRGMSTPRPSQAYISRYGYVPVFLTLNVKEAVDKMGVRGKHDDWCVLEVDCDYHPGVFSFERLTRMVTPDQIKTVKPLSEHGVCA